MSVLKTILKLAAPLPDITKYERYLFLGPHPDDIEIGAGATAAKLAAKGKTLCFLICTDGRYGTDELKDPLTPEELVKIKAKTLVIAGTKDMIKKEHTRLIASHIPDSELVFLKGNHFIASKHPDEFNRAVLQFLRS